MWLRSRLNAQKRPLDKHLPASKIEETVKPHKECDKQKMTIPQLEILRLNPHFEIMNV